MLQAGQIIDGKYRIVRTIGRGGMGAVYEAIHLKIGRRVAVKVILADILEKSPEVASRFQREALAAGSIDSQHIAQVLDSGIDPALHLPYMAIELLSGEDLEGLVSRYGALPPDLVLRIAAQALLGLSKAHEANVIHRDIKSANLFLASRDAGEIVVKLLDFGIAKTRRETLSAEGAGRMTRTGAVVGSLEYISPEQAIGSTDLDIRTDIWSLGVVMYEGLCGRTPYRDLGTVGRMIIGICQTPAPAIQDIAPWVPPEIAVIVHRALRINRAHRYQTSRIMFAAVAALLRDGWTVRESMLGPVSADQKSKTAARLRLSPEGEALRRPSIAPGFKGSPSLLQANAADLVVAAGKSLHPAIVEREGTSVAAGAASALTANQSPRAKQANPKTSPRRSLSGRLPLGPSRFDPAGVFSKLEQLYAAAGRFDSLIEMYIERAKTKDPSSLEYGELQRRAAIVYAEKLGDREHALEALMRALSANYDDEEAADYALGVAAASGRTEYLMRTVGTWLDNEKDNLNAVRLCFRLAQWAVDSGQPEFANRYLLRVLRYAPDDLAVLRRLAVMYGKTEDWDDAARVLWQALDVAKDSKAKAEILYELGTLFELYLGDPRRAKICYESALEADATLEAASNAVQRMRGA